MGASLMTIIEGLHFVSHYISDAQADQEVHSFFDHGTEHSHHNLDLIENLMNHDSDIPFTELEAETDKKNQICSNEWPSNNTDVVMSSKRLDLLYAYDSRIINIPTPPPQA